jgi:hypothetical protein
MFGINAIFFAAEVRDGNGWLGAHTGVRQWRGLR